jgi:uncharacterized protein YchJ
MFHVKHCAERRQNRSIFGFGLKADFLVKQRQNDQKYPNFRKNDGAWYFNTTAVDRLPRRSAIVGREGFLPDTPE